MSDRPDLRLIVITDRAQAAPRSLVEIAAAALRGGAPAIQLRDKQATARELAELTRVLLPLIRAEHALLFVNDRIDVAIAAGADGVHLGPEDLSIEAARRIAPPQFLIGASADDPGHARHLELAGASYIGCGAVFGTRSKDVGTETIGVQRLDDVSRAVSIPVIGIGGVDLDNIDQIAATHAAGVAVVSAVMRAQDPEETTRALLRALR